MSPYSEINYRYKIERCYITVIVRKYDILAPTLIMFIKIWLSLNFTWNIEIATLTVILSQKRLHKFRPTYIFFFSIFNSNYFIISFMKRFTWISV